MEMRAGDATGAAEFADGIALAKLLPLLDVELAHVSEERAQPVTVIENDRAAGEEEIVVGKRDDTAARRLDRRADRCRNVDPEVRLPRLAVEDALAAIDAAD